MELVLPKSGEIFDARYELFEELGGGGMGCVYRARETNSERIVAVKIVRPTDGSYTDDTRARFAREVRIIANLRDPHTVRFYNFATSDRGLLYMVFEYVPGRDLSSLIENAGRLDPTTTVHILAQVLQSLREAHAAGLMHRDIKPDNIRVYDESDGLHVKLLDFGIARQIAPGRGDSITAAGELIGTPRYMSPEQLTERELTPTSDIYSLGIVAFEMLMGAEAVQGNRWSDQVDRLVTGYVFSIPELERVGAPLAEIVRRMSARNVQDRYQSAEAVLSALNELGVGSPGGLPTVRGSAPERPTTRRRVAQKVAEIPPWMWALFLLVVTLLVVAAVNLLQTDETPRAVASTSRNTLLKSAAPLAAVRQPVLLPDVASHDIGADTPFDVCSQPPEFTGLGYLRVDDFMKADWPTYVPEGYQPGTRHPLLVVLHQDAQTPREVMAETNMAKLAEQENVVVIAPRSVGFVALKPPDVRPARDAIRFVQQRLCIDPDRIYVLGHGPGAVVAMKLACEDRTFAAVATSSYLQFRMAPLCDEFEKTPYLSLVPLKDGHVPPEGGSGCSIIRKLSLEEHEAQFRERNQCKGARRVDRTEKSGTCYTWDCESAYSSCHIDGGRGWPNAPLRGLNFLGKCDGEPAKDFPYQDVMWDFFESAGNARAKAGK